MHVRMWFCAALAAACAALPVGAQSVPHLEKRGSATQLIVDRKPFLVLAGELHNNSASSLEYLKPIWPRLAAMHVTVYRYR